MQKRRLLSIGEASEYLGVSIDTLRRWEKKGRIEALRSPGGHRYFIKENLDKLFGKKYTRDEKYKIKIGEKAEEKFFKTNTVDQPAKDQIFEFLKLPQVLDRPVREIAVPKIEPIRIIPERPSLYTNEAYLARQSVSVLTPSPEYYKQEVEEIIFKKQFSSQNSKTLFLILSVFAFFAFFLLLLWWSSSQRILSPVP